MNARALFLGLALMGATPALSQQAAIDFGGLSQDTSLPVEVAADNLDVNQNDGSAVFTGNVLVTQGEMKLSADRIQVSYAGGDEGRIKTLNAIGAVTLVNGAEAAEAGEAVYDIDEGNVVMTGDVLLTQGQTALSGNRLVIDLTSGTGRMEGRVRTIFQTSDN